MRSRRAAVGLLVMLLLLAGCTVPRPAGPVGRCNGVTFEQVRGRAPSYVGSTLARFPNDSAMCRALWLPTADRWFVPQGLALDGDTAWVSGYRWRAALGDRACRLVHVSLRTGRLLASTDRLEAAVYGPRLTFCRHGGAILKDRHGLWVVEKERLWLVDPDRVGRSDQVRRVWRLEEPVHGSVLLGGSRSVIGVGSWRDGGPGRMRWFRYRDLLSDGVTALVADGRRTPAPDEAESVRSAATVRRVQGIAPARGAAAGRGAWSTSSVSSCGMLISPAGARLAFLPGAEGIEFDGRGGLWVVSETAARSYQSAGRPLVPMLARFDVAQLKRGRPPGCSW